MRHGLSRFDVIKEFFKKVVDERPDKTFTTMEFKTFIDNKVSSGLADFSGGQQTSLVYLSQLSKTNFVERIITGTYKIKDTIPDDLTYYEFYSMYKTCVNTHRIALKEKERTEELERNTEALLKADEKGESMLDVQIGGTHYKTLQMQPLELIVPLGIEFIPGCIVKYVSRYKNKNGIEDIKKCVHYAQLAMQLESKRLPGVKTKKSKSKTLAEFVDRYCALNNITGYEQFIINYAVLNKWEKVLYGCNKLLAKLTEAKEDEDLL